MLHKCPECSAFYLTSDYARMCNLCGSYLQQQIEKLHEVDDAIEWWRICSWANFGVRDELDQSQQRG